MMTSPRRRRRRPSDKLSPSPQTVTVWRLCCWRGGYVQRVRKALPSTIRNSGKRAQMGQSSLVGVDFFLQNLPRRQAPSEAELNRVLQDPQVGALPLDETGQRAELPPHARILAPRDADNPEHEHHDKHQHTGLPRPPPPPRPTPSGTRRVSVSPPLPAAGRAPLE